MSTQRVLILCHDVKKIVSFVQTPSLKGVHLSIFPDWESSAAALRKENFSVIVAQKILPNGGAGAFVSEIMSLAPKTPLILVLAENDGPSVLDALKAGASEILFEESLGGTLATSLEKYLFSGYGLLRRMSLDELFDFCIPVITTTDMNLLAGTILEKFREALGASFGVLFQEGDEAGTPYVVHSAIGFADEAAPLRSSGASGNRHAERGHDARRRLHGKLEAEAPGGRWPLDEPVSPSDRFDMESGKRFFSVVGCGAPRRGTPSTARC
jgi:hypothetical protein